MLILGLSPFRHHASAAVLQNGLIRAAIENAKLTRSSSGGLPNSAMNFCLESAGIGWRELDAIAVATRPLKAWLRRSLSRAKLSVRSPLASAYYAANDIGSFARDLNDLRILRQRDGAWNKTSYFDHHLCHAACAYFLSPFDQSLIVTLDEDGDGDSGLIALGKGNRIRVLRRLRFPHSVAWIYSQVTNLIGFSRGQEEQKTQWLSLEGQPEYKTVFLQMLRKQGSLVPRLDLSFFERGLAKRFIFSSKFYAQTGLPTDSQQLSEQQRRALARSIQDASVQVLSELAEYLRRQHRITQICFAGGLFQNALLVASLEKNLGMDHLFVPPTPGNAGTAVGAALLQWHHALDKPRSAPVSHVYWGPKLTGQQTKDVLDNSKSGYLLQTTEERKLDSTIQLLNAGKIVGWVQGACEFGPRALGNRSILASPWAPYVRENLNDFIKFREWFRPFGISIPEEDCRRYFECSQLCWFMSSLGWVRPDSVCLPDSFLLSGARVRLHVVTRSSNPLFWRLLKRFGEHAPAPILVNTSFNMFGDPLVVTPRDAIRSYYCSGIDALVIDNFVLLKTPAAHLLKTVEAARVSSDFVSAGGADAQMFR